MSRPGDVTEPAAQPAVSDLRERLTAAGIELTDGEWLLTLKAFAPVQPLIARLQLRLDREDEPPAPSVPPGAA